MKYTFIAVGPEVELIVFADSEKVAHKMAWELLTDEQKNATECLDCVDEQKG